jgi:hypothetical protein
MLESIKFAHHHQPLSQTSAVVLLPFLLGGGSRKQGWSAAACLRECADVMGLAGERASRYLSCQSVR